MAWTKSDEWKPQSWWKLKKSVEFRAMWPSSLSLKPLAIWISNGIKRAQYAVDETIYAENDFHHKPTSKAFELIEISLKCMCVDIKFECLLNNFVDFNFHDSNEFVLTNFISFNIDQKPIAKIQMKSFTNLNCS